MGTSNDPGGSHPRGGKHVAPDLNFFEFVCLCACASPPRLSPPRMASRKKRRVEQLTGDKDYLSKCDQVCEELRELQWKSNCSTQTLQLILDALRGKLGRLVKEGDLPRKATSGDKTMQEMVHPAFVLFFISKLFFVTPHLGRGESSVVTRLWRNLS